MLLLGGLESPGFWGTLFPETGALRIPSASAAAETDPSVSFLQMGLTGDIETDIVVAQLEEDAQEVFGHVLNNWVTGHDIRMY